MILAVKIVMTIATLFYIVGFSYRTRNNGLHRKLMITGFIFTLSIALVLAAGVNIFGAGYTPAPWLASVAGDGAGAVLIAHRLLATLSLLLLISQVAAGLLRHPWHRRLARLTIPAWLVTYVSGMAVFV